MITDLQIVRPQDVDAFEREAGAFLLRREAENCVILGLCSQMRTGSTTLQASSPYFGVVRSGDEIVGVALIAGYLVLLSNPIDHDALSLLVADIASAAPTVPGVVAEPAASRRFAEIWTSHTGRAHQLNMSERIFRLERVTPPRLVEGGMRLAESRDRSTLAAWLREFSAEALRQTVELEAMAQFADRWIARSGRAMYFWEIGGQPVSMVGVSGETPNGIRVAPVYTPPELRGRGYASALVAAVTQAQLDSGKRYCFLFTDVANPTSNKIYRAIGYELVADAAEYRFDPPA